MVGRRRRRIVVEIDADSRRARRELRIAEARVRRFGRNVARDAGRVGLAFGGAAAAVTTLAGQFESQFARIQGLVGLSSAEINTMRESVLGLGAATARGPRELADGLFLVTSAGFRGAEALELLEVAGRASAVGLGSVSDVANATTAAISAYGSANLSAAESGDILVAAVRAGRLEADQFSRVIGPLSGQAANLGIAYNDAAAGVAALSRVTDTSAAATQIRGIFTAITRPAAEAQTALQAVGLSVGEFQSLFSDRGLLGGLEALAATNVPLEQIFRDTQALIGAQQLLGPALADNQAIFDDVAMSAGVLDEAFEIVSDTAEFRLRSELARLETESIRLGQVALPAVSDALGVVSTVGRRAAIAVGELPPALGAITTAVGVVGLGGLILGPRIAGGIRNLRTLRESLTTIANAGGNARNALAGFGATLLGPGGAGLLAAIGAVGVGWALVADDIRRAREEAERLRDVTREADPTFGAAERVRDRIRTAAEDQRLTPGQQALLDQFGALPDRSERGQLAVRTEQQIRESLAQILPDAINLDDIGINTTELESALPNILRAAEAATRPDIAFIGRGLTGPFGRDPNLFRPGSFLGLGDGVAASTEAQGRAIFQPLIDLLGTEVVGLIIDIGEAAAAATAENQSLSRELLESADVRAFAQREIGNDAFEALLRQADATGDYSGAVDILDERLTGLESSTDAAADATVELAAAEMGVASAANEATNALTATQSALLGLTSPTAAGFGAPAAAIDFRRSLGRLETAVTDGLVNDIPDLLEQVLSSSARAIEAAGPGPDARGIAQTTLDAIAGAAPAGGFSDAETARIRRLVNRAGSLTLGRVRGQQTGPSLEPIFDAVADTFIAPTAQPGSTAPPITYNNFFVEAGADRVARQQELTDLALDEGTRR